jgi:tryptophan-rich sensory protein
MYIRLLAFLLLNIGALLIGGLFTGQGVPSEWYTLLNKAPWTPPGWVFGTAWSLIMICFAVYMAIMWGRVMNRAYLIALYTLQWVLNVSWNPIFFAYHQVLAALVVISALTVVIFLFLYMYFRRNALISSLILPYFIWLLIATSLNAYIYISN